MTIAQLHRRHTLRQPVTLALGMLALCASCALEPNYEPLVSPYAPDRRVTIAVAPLINESGTTVLDEIEVADAIANTIQSIDGMSVIPLNRTIAAMRSLGLNRVLDPEESVRLARRLGADGIVVGTITAWQPYDPPQIGMNLALFASSEALRSRAVPEIDPRALTSAQREFRLPESWERDPPVSTVSDFLDAREPRVLDAVTRYARLRDDPPHALGTRQYTANMKLYATFVSHELVSRLLDLESARLTWIGAREQITNRR